MANELKYHMNMLNSIDRKVGGPGNWTYIIDALNSIDTNLGSVGISGLIELAQNAYPSESASGNPIYIDDGAKDIPVKELIVSLEPKQSGTGNPSPTNVRPISGHDGVMVKRTGKNLFGGALAQVDANALLSDSLILPSGTYTLSFKYNGTPTWGVYVRKGHTRNAEVIKSVYNQNTITFTLTEATQVCFSIYYSNGITTSEVTDVQIEIGSTATEYEPYQGEEYSITFPSSVSTVYGGKLNVTTGVLTVDKGIETFDGSSDEGWGEYTSFNGYYTRMSLMADGVRMDGISNMLINSKSSSSSQSNVMWLGVGNRNIYVIGVRDSMGTTLSDFLQYLNSKNLQVVYPLATPQTYQLTPTEVSTLLGGNTIQSDGSMELTYRADTTKVIEKLTNAIISMGGNV